MTEVPRELWTLREFAEWMRVTVWAVRAMLKRGQLPKGAVVRVGRRVRLRVDVVRAWYERRVS